MTKQKKRTLSATKQPNEKKKSRKDADYTPKVIAQTTEPHDHDVLLGRGGRSNNHMGNIHFRTLVEMNKQLYFSCPKKIKMLVAASIVEAISKQEPPGRFLERAKGETNVWQEADFMKARRKTSQALRDPSKLSKGMFESFMSTVKESLTQLPQDEIQAFQENSSGIVSSQKQHGYLSQANCLDLNVPPKFDLSSLQQPLVENHRIKSHDELLGRNQICEKQTILFQPGKNCSTSILKKSSLIEGTASAKNLEHSSLPHSSCEDETSDIETIDCSDICDDPWLGEEPDADSEPSEIENTGNDGLFPVSHDLFGSDFPLMQATTTCTS